MKVTIMKKENQLWTMGGTRGQQRTTIARWVWKEGVVCPCERTARPSTANQHRGRLTTTPTVCGSLPRAQHFLINFMVFDGKRIKFEIWKKTKMNVRLLFCILIYLWLTGIFVSLFFLLKDCRHFGVQTQNLSDTRAPTLSCPPQINVLHKYITSHYFWLLQKSYM